MRRFLLTYHQTSWGSPPNTVTEEVTLSKEELEKISWNDFRLAKEKEWNKKGGSAHHSLIAISEIPFKA